MEKYLGIVLIFFLAYFINAFQQSPAVLSATAPSPTEILPITQPVITQSSFITKLKETTEKIVKQTIYQDDPETEAGEEKILEEGKDGQRTKIYKITYSKDGEEYEKTLISTRTVPATDQRILRGTKIIWKTLDTPGGGIKYWKKMRVYATHYDSRCLGCNEWTSIGMRAGKGVIAVDPKVIPLKSKVYIPGYGTAIAGDTGGAIKGNIIDLGFEDAKTAGWRARFIDIYLLN